MKKNKRLNVLNRNIKVGPKAPFVENLLIVEGITRSGKFLLSNVLSGFKDIEPIQYSTLLEQIPFLSFQGLIDRSTAKELIRCEVDMRSYETLIGRNLNYRISDKSSIRNNPNYKKFISRSSNPNIENMINQFKKEKPYSPFVLHESMSQIEIYFETFPKMRCISIRRDPIDLAYSWLKRGLGKRWGNDPLLFQIPFSSGENKTFPWFSVGWEGKYSKCNEIDRILLSIIALLKKSKKAYKSFPSSIKKKILVISFEDLLTDPNNEIKRVSKFLARPPLKEMGEILKREGLPSNYLKDKQKEKLQKLYKIGNKKYLEELLDFQY